MANSVDSDQTGPSGTVWAMSWENLFMPYTNNNGADQPAHPSSLISAFVVRCLDIVTPKLSKSKLSRPYQFSVAEEAGLSLNWSETPKTGFLVTWLSLIWVYHLRRPVRSSTEGHYSRAGI